MRWKRHSYDATYLLIAGQPLTATELQSHSLQALVLAKCLVLEADTE